MEYLRYVQWITVPIAFVLNILLVHVLLKNAGRAYVLITICGMVMLLSTVVEAAAILGPELFWNRETRKYYWIAELLLESLLYATVIVMCVRRIRQKNANSPLVRWIVLGSLLFVVISAVVVYDPRPNRWLTLVSRNLGFGALVVNLVLWSSLLPDPKKDYMMLKVSGALGVNLAGQALGQSLRHLWEVSRVFAYTGNLILVFTHIMFLYLLWRAFSWVTVARRAPAGAG
jgi:hypothetical protein